MIIQEDLNYQQAKEIEYSYFGGPHVERTIGTEFCDSVKSEKLVTGQLRGYFEFKIVNFSPQSNFSIYIAKLLSVSYFIVYPEIKP